MLCLKSASGWIIGSLEKFFYRWGIFASKHPYPVILASLILTILSGIGFLNFRQEHQADKLWIPPTSEYLVNKKWLAGNFKGQHRSEFLFFQKDNILTPEALLQMWDIHKKISDIEINGFSYKDICSPLPVGDIFHSDEASSTYICPEKEDADDTIETTTRKKDDLWEDYYDYEEDENPFQVVQEDNKDDLWPDYEDYENYDYDNQEVSSNGCIQIKPRIDFSIFGRQPKKSKAKTTTTKAKTTTTTKRTTTTTKSRTTTTTTGQDSISAASLVVSTTARPKSKKNNEDDENELPRDVKCKILESLQEKCAQSSLLEIWKYNETLIRTATQQEIIDAVNLLERSPWNSHKMNYLGSMGGKVKNSTGQTIAAKTLTMYWRVKIPDGAKLVKDQGSGLELEPADQVTLDWEQAFVNIALNTSLDGVTLIPNAARSYSDVSTDAIFFDAVKMASGYMLMFIYTIVMLGKLNSLEIKAYLAIVGIASVGMGLSIGLSLSSALGFPYTPMHAAMPFLALGIGIDDMFVIVQCWQNVKKSSAADIPISEAIGQGLKHAGVSVTITTLTDVFAFAIGSISIMPGLSSFCVSCSIALAAIYVLQLTWFVGFLALDEKRIAAGRNGIIPCIVRQNHTPKNLIDKEKIFKKFMEKYSKLLSYHLYKAGVILTSVTILAFGIWGATQIEQKFDPVLLLPKGSYLRQWTEINSEFYPRNGWGTTVYTGRMNYTHLPNMQKLMDDLQQQINKKEYIRGRNSWWLGLTKWALKKDNYTRVEDLMTKSEFPMLLSDFLHSSQGSRYKTNFEFDGELVCGEPAPPIRVSKFGVSFKAFKGPSEHIPAKQWVENVVRESGISDIAFSHVKIYAAWETDEIIGNELFRNIGLALVAVAVITLILLTNIQICSMVLCCVCLTLVDILGYLHFWNMTIDIISCVSIVLAIGLCVDYSVHIGHAFLIAPGTRLDKSIYAIETIGPAVFNGGFTTFLALSLLAFSQSSIFITFFKVFFLTVVFGLFHGLVMLPVLLSLIGPQNLEDASSNAPMSSPTSSVSPATSSQASPGPGGQFGKQGQKNLSYIQDNVISIISAGSIDEEKGSFSK